MSIRVLFQSVYDLQQLSIVDTDHKAQFEALSSLFAQLLPNPVVQEIDVDKIVRIIDTVIALETGSMVVSRLFVSLITDRLESGEDVPVDVVRRIAEGILGVIKTRTISYEEQKEGRILDAAHMLIAINSDSSPKFNGPKANSEGAKAQLCIRITQLLLAAGEIDEAEQFVNRTSVLLVDSKNEELVIEHKALQARVLDAKRRFIDAAQRFYELSVVPLLPESDRLTALAKSIICILLAKPGNLRTRLLTTLFKDERAHCLPSFEIVTKMYLHRLINTSELTEFERELQPHQKFDEDGESILKSVIQEHNITAVSQLYRNISLSTLGELLGISAEDAEVMAGEMIASERVFGYIDQTDSILHFEDPNVLQSWDQQIHATCMQVNKVSDLIVSKYPQFADFISH
ncbi:unnamed protein product [Caenorhabditis auriculariae]|uniref:COP9 signalosome complex subunit 4 n=1 Tax=Caenorhabditis auriculariae TaxID=2777116 RepID=A0A8S1HIS5_9PELO|nr:unnamed protein product [Caenorhabditis auriculariae]